MLETVFSIGRPIPVCENINSTRIRGYGSARNLWNFDAFCLSSPYLKKEALVFAVQTAPAAPGKRYYVLDTGTGELKRFTAQADFLQDTRKLGVADEELLKEHIISPL